MGLIDEDAAMVLLMTAARPSQKALAERIGISQAYLSDVLRGRRDPAHILRRLGYERVIRYRRIERAAAL